MSRARAQLHCVRLGPPGHGDNSYSLAITASNLSGDLLMHFAINAYREALGFEMPTLPETAAAPVQHGAASSTVRGPQLTTC